MTSDSPMTFWDHLEALRGVLLRIVVAFMVLAVAAFCLKEQLFAVVLAPKSAGFVTYALIDRVAALCGMGTPTEAFHAELINTGLAQQFAVHMQASVYAALLLVAPYAIYALFGFVSPGLYDRERHVARRVVAGAYAMFMAGVAVGYFIIFPLTFQFLGTYQVAADIANMITLESYMDTLAAICLMMGIMFELPVVCLLLGRMGIIDRGMMARYRRHALVVILIAAAVITPTGDALTLLAVSLPLYGLYELSIQLLPHNSRQK